VEIKTCIDTRYNDQLERAHNTDLTNMLTAHGHTVTTVPILVGVTGTIYTEHTSALTGSVSHDDWGLLPEHGGNPASYTGIIGTRRQSQPTQDQTETHTPDP
jgi:hypothetical protein